MKASVKAEDFVAKLATVNHVLKTFPNATIGEGESAGNYTDDSVNLHNADGLTFHVLKEHSILAAKCTPFKYLKRQPKKEHRIKVHGEREYDLPPAALQKILNGFDCKDNVIEALGRTLTCQ